jgi:hypothetical protein
VKATLYGDTAEVELARRVLAGVPCLTVADPVGPSQVAGADGPARLYLDVAVADPEELGRARYESGLPLLSDVGDHAAGVPDAIAAPAGRVTDGPVAELVLALVDEGGRVDGEPVAALVGIGYRDGEYAEDRVDGVTDLAEALAGLLGQLRGGRGGGP